VAPTPAGTALADGLAGLLAGMGDLRARCRAAVAPATLKVGVGAALADCWLVARLPKFLAAHPGMAVELIVVESAAQSRGLDLDVQIQWMPDRQARSSSTQRPLFRERVFPVCRPDVLPRSGRAASTVLACLPLLHKGPAESASGTEWAWQTWFERLGIDSPPAEAMRFANIGTAIAAALQGHGVVLARSLLVRDALADGRLVRVLPAKWDMPSSKVHVVRWTGARSADARLQAFLAWLVAEASDTPAHDTRRQSAAMWPERPDARSVLGRLRR
jgi:LysR family transcriptional regulator, glycine cleavage system transcriptional activator